MIIAQKLAELGRLEEQLKVALGELLVAFDESVGARRLEAIKGFGRGVGNLDRRTIRASKAVP